MVLSNKQGELPTLQVPITQLKYYQMKFTLGTLLAIPAAALFMTACNNGSSTTSATKDSTKTPTVQVTNVTIDAGGVPLNSVVAFNDDTITRKPVIVIVPEWWGLDTHVKNVAQRLAELGYFAIGLDMYGNSKLADNPDTAKAWATPFYANPRLANERILAAIAKAKTYSVVDTANIAAIGYCFGGSCVLNAARLGTPLKAVASLHGGLATSLPISKDLFKAAVLICHGAADKFVSPEEVATFKKQMDSAGVKYVFKEYANATHAFTNPAATATGKKFNMPIEYNAAADTASWNDMKAFLGAELR